MKTIKQQKMELKTEVNKLQRETLALHEANLGLKEQVKKLRLQLEAGGSPLEKLMAVDPKMASEL